MAGVNQLLPFANGETPNVLSYDEWNALAARLSGFQSGIASSKQFNYILAQGGAAGYVIGQIVADYTTETATISATPLYQAFKQAMSSFVADNPILATGTTTARSAADRFADVINVRDFGAEGNGTTDDTEAIQAALDYAGTKTNSKVVFPFGTYLVTDELLVPSDCVVDGMGSIVEVNNDITIFTIEGSLGAEIPLGAEATSGDKTLTTAQDHGLAEGDMALLWSQRNSLSESAGDFRLGYHQGSYCYFAEPVSIKSVSSSRIVGLQSGLIFPDYRLDDSQDVDTNRSTSTLSKLNFANNIVIRNLNIRHFGAGAVVSARYAKNLLVENVTVNTSIKNIYGVSLFGCYAVRIDGLSQFGDPATDVDFDTDGFWKWTAVGCSSSWYVDVENCHFGAVPNGVDFTFYGDHWCSMFCNMRNCFVVGATANGSTSHPGVYEHSFSGNTFVDCEVGLTVRGRKARVIGNTLICAKQKDWNSDNRAIILFTSAIESVVSNHVIDGYYYGIVDFAYVSNVAMLQRHKNLYIGNNIKNSFDGIVFEEGPENNVEKVEAIVANNNVEFDNIGILCKSWRHGVVTHGNYFRASDQKQTSATAVVIKGDSIDNKVFDNVIENARSYQITFTRTDSAYSEFIDSNNNNLFGYDVKFGEGAYLNNSTYPKVSKRYDKIIVTGVGTSVQNEYASGTLIAVEGENGATVSIVSSDNAGYSTYDFLDKDLARKASVGYAYSANRLNIGVEGNQWSFREGSFSPNVDDSYSVGTAGNRVSTVYAASGTINTSDERAKTAIVDVDDAIIRACEKVNFKVFQYKDAVAKKGEESARHHVGVIAQQVIEAFESEGLDPFALGIVCYDEWSDHFEYFEVTDQPEVLDENGVILTPAVTHFEKRKVLEAGNRYGIRYDELFALGFAAQRKRMSEIESNLQKLIEKVGGI